MIKVSGKVLVKESGIGIANLLVLLYDVDNRIKLESVFQAGNVATAVGLIEPFGQSIGSAITDQDGSFNFHCAIQDVNSTNLTLANRKNVNLLLLVSTPEEFGSDQSGRLLYVSPRLRNSIGYHETFLIQLKQNRLEKLGLLNFLHTRGPQAHITSVSLFSKNNAQVRKTLTQAAASRVSASRAERDQYKSFEKKLVRSISRLPDNLVKGELRVAPGDSVEAVNKKAIASDLDGKINRSKRRTRYYFTDQQLQELRDTVTDSGIGFETLRRVAMQNGGSEGLATPQLARHKDLIVQCLNKISSESEADRLLLDIESEEDGPGNGADTPDAGDRSGRGVVTDAGNGLPNFIARLIGTATTPEEMVTFGLLPGGKRPTQEDVQANIGNLLMKPGPADRPAIFDFHSLQIAFDHVWQELISEEVLEEAELLYAELKELGGDPEAAQHANKSPLEALRDETAAVMATLDRGENSAIFLRRSPRNQLSGGGLLDGRYAPPDNGGGGGGGGNGRPPGLDTAVDYNGPGYFDKPPPDTFLNRLRALLNRLYAFTIFGANSKERSVNFGIIVTYRQKWTPVAYQAGDLVKTITLAPKESRKFSRKMTVNRKRAEKEVEKASSLRRDEFNQTTRAEVEIMRKARAKTNFNLSTDGTYNFGVAEGTADMDFGRDAEEESAETKKDFREAVIKAVQEYKGERSLEVETETTEALEEVESGEITNPNDELAVTFLFYELQRRFRLHEEIHRLTPVVLVAQEVPNPSAITDAWLVQHDWILKRSLLDDSFRPALDYLVLRYAGDIQAKGHLYSQLILHQNIVEQLRDDLVALKAKEAQAYQALQNAIQERYDQVKGEDTDGFWSDVGDFFGGDGQSPEAARILEDAARDAADRAAAEVKELTMRLEREVTALNAVSDKYQKVLVDHNNWTVQIDRLRLHVRDNILYYMQAIWLHEVPDQRYFRLFQTKVPTFSENGSTYQVVSATDEKMVISNVDGADIATAVDMEITPSLTVQFDGSNLKSLVEVADLDKMLGFKGNYMIFPLRESNPLTDIMMDPFVNTGFNDILSLVDPDEAGNMSREDFAEYVVCLHDALGEAEFAELKPALKSQYRRILQAVIRPGEEIVVPSGSLYIEALPAAHPLLEDFKLIHRAVDVKKVQAEVREMELDNVRQAERVLQGILGDPDIEKTIVIESDGGGPGIVVDDD